MKLKIVLVFFCSFSLFVSSCANKEGNDRENSSNRIHPTRENIPDKNNIDNIISRDTLSISSNGLQNIANRIATSRHILTIGSADENKGEVFGLIEDIAVNSKGDILVLDQRLNNILVYNREGKYINRIGRNGRGPGEFGAVENLSLDSFNDDLYVLDRYLKIEKFRLINDKYEYNDTYHINGPSLFGCKLDSMLVYSGFIREYNGIAHLLSTQSKNYLNSIGQSYQDNSYMVRSDLSIAPIGCNERSFTIVIGFLYFPYLYAYDHTGEVKWISQLDNFDIQQIRETESGSVVHTLSKKKPYHTINNFTSISDTEYMVVQTAYYNDINFPHYSVVYTYLISSVNGQGIFVTDKLPVIRYADEHYFYTSEILPYPRVKVYSY